MSLRSSNKRKAQCAAEEPDLLHMQVKYVWWNHREGVWEWEQKSNFIKPEHFKLSVNLHLKLIEGPSHLTASQFLQLLPPPPPVVAILIESLLCASHPGLFYVSYFIFTRLCENK